ncbi:MAG: guanylate kinase [Chloroflexota bacterium]
MSAVPEPALTELRAKAAGRHVARLFVLSAPSGAGKDTVLKALRRRGLPIHVVVTCTTRPRRAEEVDGVDYQFVSQEAFERLREQSELLEHAEYSGHSYGTPKQPAREALARGEDTILKIEVQGAADVKRQFPGTVMIFLAPPDLSELERRLRKRGEIDPVDLRRRLDTAVRELAAIPQYDYLVINHANRMEEAAAQVEHIILAERCRVGVPPVRL